MMEEIADFDTLVAYAQELKKTGFHPGIDDMSGDSAVLWLTINREKLLAQLKKGTYEPMPVLCRHLAKRDGKTRLVGKATAVDTVIQRALVNALNKRAEPIFSPDSFAYRRGRGVGSALEKYCEYAGSFRYASKLDFVRCFDNIDHETLREALPPFTEDTAADELIMRFVTAPEYAEGELRAHRIGLHQGVPLSPVLCNIYMHALDVWLTQRNVSFVRYADDVVLFGDNGPALMEVTQQAADFVADSLHLVVNVKKANLTASSKQVFLGHRFAVDSSGLLSVVSSDTPEKIYRYWNRDAAYGQKRTSAEILRDGILRQKDYTVLFDAETDDRYIPIQSVDTINVYSNVVFDTEFLKRTLRCGVPVNIFDSKTSEYIGSFLPNSPLKSERTTYEQLQVYHLPEHRLALAKEFVLAANHNIRLNLRYYQKHRNTDQPRTSTTKLYQLDAEIKQCESLDALLLLEARSKAAYYECFDLFINSSDFLFEVRTRKPPRNEVNAMLSFGNTMLYNYIAMEINKTPLDVRVGFLHATNKRLNSLNLDLADVFKPLIVDRTVFSLINRRRIRQLHFETMENGAVYLTHEGKRIFIEAFYSKMATTLSIHGEKCTYFELIRREIRSLVQFFRHTGDYRAFRQVR